MNKKAFSLIELSIVLVIIGLLIAGIVGGQKLVYYARLTSARAVTKSSAAATTENLKLWLEATSLNSFDASDAVDGHTVSNWYDINTQRTDQNSVTAGTAATYSAIGANGLPAVHFSSASLSRLQRTNVLGSNLVNPNEMTLFFVANTSSNSPNYGEIVYWEDSNGNRLQVCSLRGTSTFLVFAGGCCNSSDSISYNPSTLSVDSLSIVSMYRRTDNTAAIRINGTTVATSTTLSANFITGASSTLYIGGDNSAERFDGYIGEILIYDRGLSDTEIKAIEQYLARKWKIVISYS